MRFAYADPPYIGKAYLYRNHPDFDGEVDHGELIRSLSTYDGWALSCSAESLPAVLALCPAGVRVAVWVKGAVPGRSVSTRNAYEAVVYFGGRVVVRGSGTDVLVHGVGVRRTDPAWVIGAKPAAFAYWLFELLGMSRSDELVDVYPGSGGVGRAWDLWRVDQEAQSLSVGDS